MLSEPSTTLIIVWFLANTLLFFLFPAFWDWAEDKDKTIVSLILMGYGFLCFGSCIIVSDWFGVDEDKQVFFCLGGMVILLFIHIWYYEYQE
jgi:hypothetical protein